MPGKKKTTAPKENLGGEVKKTGKLIKAHITKALQSNEGKKAKKAVDSTLDKLVVELNKLIEAAKKSDIEQKAKTGTYKGVQKVNSELTKYLKKWDKK